MSAYLGSDRSSPCTWAADAYHEWGGVAGDDALDIVEMGTHPISLRTKITPADTFSARPASKPLHRPPISDSAEKTLARAHHHRPHLSGLFDQKILDIARIPDKYDPQIVDF